MQEWASCICWMVNPKSSITPVPCTEGNHGNLITQCIISLWTKYTHTCTHTHTDTRMSREGNVYVWICMHVPMFQLLYVWGVFVWCLDSLCVCVSDGISMGVHYQMLSGYAPGVMKSVGLSCLGAVVGAGSSMWERTCIFSLVEGDVVGWFKHTGGLVTYFSLY